MAIRGIPSSHSNHHQGHPCYPILQNLTSLSPLLSPTPAKAAAPRSSSPCSASSDSHKWTAKFPSAVRRRMLNVSTVGFLLSFADQPFSGLSFFSNSLASQTLELHRYTDSIQGFTLLIPSSWTKVDKAGATVLFEDVMKKANNVGVVVSPTRISSLGEFGSPEFVADKLIQAERRKESTKEAEVISFSERSGPGGLQVYEFEYKIDSTRGGLKRVFSAAFVASKKLYLLNINQSDGLENPLDMERRTILEQVLHSFDPVPST